MGGKTKIEWTEISWNPVTGCTKASPGCENCYAEAFSYRLMNMGMNKYRNGFKVTMHVKSLKEPYKINRPAKVFVNSMSDLFHKDVSDAFISRVFKVMNECPHIQFQVLTKRSERLPLISPKLNWTPNIWMGVSIENSDYLYRIKDLKKTDAHIKFISFEPLLGRIKKTSLSGIDWVIVGGESGPKARPMNPEWVMDIRDMCIIQHVPFFFKQWGGFNKHKNGNLLEGKTYQEYPEDLIEISAK